MTKSLQIAMSRTEAEQVTSRIKLLVENVAATTEKIITLIEQAESGKAWQALGYQSWTAYVQSEFAESLTRLQRAERIPVVQKLSSTGMSTRAIASVVGAGKSTVDRDLAGVPDGTPAPAPVTGIDGKTYLRNGKPTAEAMEALSKDVPEVRRKPRRPSLPDAYWNAVYDLDKAVRRLEKLHADDRFAQHQKDLHDRHWRLLSEIESVVTDMGNERLSCSECGDRMLPSRTFESKCEGCR